MIDKSGNMLYHINNLNTQSERISYQMASGKVIDQGSDDAMLHAEVINLENKLRVTEGLKLQIEKTRALNDSADASIGEVKLSLDSIKLDLMKGLNDGMDRSDKLALATNLEGIRENLIDRVNSEVDGEYLFAGSVTTNQTLVKDTNFELNGNVNFNGDAFLREIAVQPGSYRDRGVTAYDVSFYNASTASAGEEFTFADRERIIDENGNEWKLDNTTMKLQQYDKNGILEEPIVELPVLLDVTSQFTIDLGIGTNLDATGDYNVEIDGTTYTHTAAGESANDVYLALKAAIEADGYRVSSLSSDDQFIITRPIGSTADIGHSRVYDTDTTYDSTATNEIEAASGFQAVRAKYVIDSLPTSPEGRLLEAKHNYFDDLNVVINALNGHVTKLDGTKGNIASDDLVNDTLRIALGQTTDQFNASNVGHGELGGRNNVFEVAYDKITAQETHYNILIQETNGADLAKLAMESKSLDMTYQALYSTIAKMNELSLINFLK